VEAEDVVQETFVALLKLEAPPEQPWFYCLRAFRHRALNYHRSVWRRIQREFESRRWFETTPETDPQEIAAMRCLERLPAPQREVIVLKIWHQHTFEEIASLLHESPNTVAARYRYGLDKLRHFLQEHPHEYPACLGEPFGRLETASSFRLARDADLSP
jgi:RNA polymerase sigma-70 factor (ECF subfamily)